MCLPHVSHVSIFKIKLRGFTAYMSQHYSSMLKINVVQQCRFDQFSVRNTQPVLQIKFTCYMIFLDGNANKI